MTDQQKVSTIKRINERLSEIQRQVDAGKLPQSAADNYRAAVEAVAGDYLTKKGNISHGKNAIRNIGESELKRLLNRSTAGQIKERVKEGARQEYGEDLTEEDIEEYITDIDYVNNAMVDDPSETYDAYQAAFAGSSGKKSYKQLRAAIEAYRGDGATPTISSVDRLFS